MLLVSIIIARILGKEVFGQYSLIRNTVAIFEVYINYALAPLTIKYISENKYGIRNILTSILIILILVIFFVEIIIFLLAEYIVVVYFKDPTLLLPFLSSSLIFIGSSIMGIAISILTGFEFYKKILLTTIISFLFGFPILMYLMITYQLIGIMIGIGLYFLIDGLIKLIYISKKLQDSDYSINKDKIKKTSVEIIKFSIPLFLSSSLLLPTLWYSKTLLLEYNYTFSDLAGFEAAYQWLTVILIITGSITNISLPLFSKLLTKTKELHNILTINLIINFLISFFMTLFIYFFSEYIMSLYGDDFKTDDSILILLAISSIFISLNAVLTKYFISIEEKWLLLINSLFWASSFLIMCFLWIPNEGIIGLANSFLISYIISFLIYVIMFFYAKDKYMRKMSI
jgi:O-antigen/teichoic acid export membrane protein